MLDPTPRVCIDYDIVTGNIQRALTRMKPYGLAHRPHIKAHKSVELARLQIEKGCKGITCAKLSEAEIMANAGIDDILLAYPLIGEEKLQRYGALIQRGIHIMTIVNSLYGANGLSRLGKQLDVRLPVLIEMDGHIGRGGLKMGADFEDFARELKKLDGIEVKGVEVYSGDIYDLKTEERIRLRAREERSEILECANTLKKLGMRPEVLSGGSSFSVLYPEELEGITEIRAGNYIFNDNALFSIGLIPREYCAMTVKAMVVGKARDDVAIIDAGSKTLSSDLVHLHEGYGAVIGHPQAEITKLNEEHGFVHMAGLEVGDILEIIPNHACVIPNLYDRLPAYRGEQFDHWIKIDARGMNY